MTRTRIRLLAGARRRCRRPRLAVRRRLLARRDRSRLPHAARRPTRPCSAGCSPGCRARRHADVRRAARAPRRASAGRRGHACPARLRLPAARARDRRPELLLALRARLRAARSRAADRGGSRATGLASLAVSRHRFRDALAARPRGARGSTRRTPTAYGALGDALLESGPLPRRRSRAFDRMAELSPSVASYARIALRARAARPPACRCRGAPSSRSTLDARCAEHRAAALVQLGNVRFNAGRLGEAARAPIVAALAGAARLRPRAEAGLARVDGRRREATCGRSTGSAAVVETLPLPAVRDLARRRPARRPAWRPRPAEPDAARGRDRASLRRERRPHRAPDGALRPRPRAPTRATRSRALAARLRARAEHPERADVLAWALARNGRCAEALVDVAAGAAPRHARRAVRSSTAA